MMIKRLLHIHPFLERFQGLMLMLFPKLSLPGLVRISLGIENTQNDIDTMLQVLDRIARQPRSGRAGMPASLPPVLHEDFQRQMDEFTRDASGRVYAYSLESQSTTSEG